MHLGSLLIRLSTKNFLAGLVQKQNSLLSKLKTLFKRKVFLIYESVPRLGIELYEFSTGCRHFISYRHKIAGNLFDSYPVPKYSRQKAPCIRFLSPDFVPRLGIVLTVTKSYCFAPLTI